MKNHMYSDFSMSNVNDGLNRPVKHMLGSTVTVICCHNNLESMKDWHENRHLVFLLAVSYTHLTLPTMAVV